MKVQSQHVDAKFQQQLPLRGRKRASLWILGVTVVGCGAYYASLSPREKRLVHVAIGGIGRFIRSAV